MSGTPVKRRKLLKPRSAKYYARKAKIEQALRSLGSSHTLPPLPDSLDIPFSAFSFNRSPQRIDESKISQDQEILAIPTCSSSWVSTATKIENVLLPRALTKMSEAEMNAKAPLLFNMDIWNKLPAAQRTELEKLLPDFSSVAGIVNPVEARHQTLQQLFQNENFHFGNPIQIFLQRLAHKQFQPQRRETIQREKLLQQFSYVRALKERNFQMIRKMMEMKEALEVNEPRDYLLLPPPSQQASAAHLARDYEVCSDTDGDSEEEQTLAAHSQKDILRKLDAAVQRKGPEEDQSVLGKRARDTADESNERKSSSSLKNLLFDDSLPPEVIPSGPVWAFFGTLRDLFVAHQHVMSLDALEEAYQQEEGRMADISPGYTLRQFLQLGLDFLQHPPSPAVTRQVDRKPKPATPNGAKTEANANPASMASILNPVEEIESSSNSPAISATPGGDKDSPYQPGCPYVNKTDDNHWQWVGATDEETIREELDILELLFYYAVTRKQVNESLTQVELVPPKQQKCTSTIRTSTPDELEKYRQQERERYLAPEYPYCYQFRGAECVVAPMNRGLGNQSQKPRDHFLLQKDRPPHISLLCLVRDAAARLPGGMGTRPDVAMLLLDSQYVNSDVPEGKLNTVVSGALDRLHSQKDPCVKFDSDQKLWIYLHRRRVEANFGK